MSHEPIPGWDDGVKAIDAMFQNKARKAHSLQRPCSPAPLSGEWRCSGHMICCGTLRIAVFDIDTKPSDEFIAKLGAWMCRTLNEAQGNAELKHGPKTND